MAELPLDIFEFPDPRFSMRIEQETGKNYCRIESSFFGYLRRAEIYLPRQIITLCVLHARLHQTWQCPNANQHVAYKGSWCFKGGGGLNLKSSDLVSKHYLCIFIFSFLNRGKQTTLLTVLRVCQVGV